MRGKWDSINCMMEFTEILKNEPEEACDYIRTHYSMMQSDDIVNILCELLCGMKNGCYHPQYEQIMEDVQIELDEHYEDDYMEYNEYMRRELQQCMD